MFKQILLICSCLLIAYTAFSQNVQGVVYELNNEGQEVALEGAHVYWLGTTTGSISGEKGHFSLPATDKSNQLVVQFIGHLADTILVNSADSLIKVVLKSFNQMHEVQVTASGTSLVSSRPILTQVITEDGLRKAACCNLAESFESSAAVDVSYSDAVSGAKQIQMLGLAGIYSQIMLENTPYIRGLALPFGLMYVPGSWMESISISKGTSSVINGYESITGQIDVNYKNAETNKEKVAVNLFLNTMLRNELDFNTRISVKENVATMLLFHYGNLPMRWDHNSDGFIDLPLNTQVNFMNRWDYKKPGKMTGRTLLSYLYDTRLGGEMDFNRKTDRLTNNRYGIGIDNHRLNIISKNGALLKGNNESIGTIASFTYHRYSSFYGLNSYFAEQISGYANAFYENFLDKKEHHKIDAGISFQIDAYNESCNDSAFARLEAVPGVFVQYSFILQDKLIVMAGMRADYNSQYGLFWTPRLHGKWQLAKHSALRFSAGKGYRSPNIYIDNTSLMASSRQFTVEDHLKAEEAYNAGISFTQTFTINHQECSFLIDYYYTHFVNQVIVDIDRDYHYVYFSNLKGKSYSHAVQAELTIYPFKRFEITAAYRFNYVRETINGILREKPLANQHKAVVNFNYSTRYEKWKFNLTMQLYGKARLPDASSLPAEWQWEPFSPVYAIFNAQINKKWKHVELYIGAENFTNYKQKHAIIDSQHPFGDYFDASMIWGPITGVMVYAGLRLTFKYSERVEN